MGSDLARVVRAQQQGCEIGGSDLYTTVLEEVAVDVGRGGPCARVLAAHAEEPVADAVVLRLLAAVHELVLAGEAPDLARHYPSVGGVPGPGVGAAFVAAVADHRARVAQRTAAPIQTNEVGRSAALLGGYLAVAATGLPLRVLEVGASAGLNLRFDRFRYEAGGHALGPEGAPVVLREPWVDRRPDLTGPVQVVERRGCDLRPLDPLDAGDRMRLRACLWPDQPDRRARLDGALAVAAEVPAPVDRADAAAWTDACLAEPRPGVATVVVHSIVAQYLSPRTRRDLQRAVTRAGAAATPEAPVAWLRMEPSSVQEAEVRLTCWPDDRARGPEGRVLAHSAFHGPPVRWEA